LQLIVAIAFFKAQLQIKWPSGYTYNMVQTTPQTQIRTHKRGASVTKKVLQITLEQLANQGYERLSVPEIANLAGLNKTSIYRRWPTKQSLVRDALEGTTGEDIAIPNTGSFRSDFIAITRNAIEFAASPIGMGVLRVLLNEGNNPHIRELASSMLRHQKTIDLQIVFKRAIARGEIAKFADIPLAFSVVSGAMLQRIFVEQSVVNDEFLESLVDLILFGLSGPR
jgi:AcrR family transcriptional regulator